MFLRAVGLSRRGQHAAAADAAARYLRAFRQGLRRVEAAQPQDAVPQP